MFCSRIFNIYFGFFAPETALLGRSGSTASGPESLVLHSGIPFRCPAFASPGSVRISPEKCLPAKCRSTETGGNKVHSRRRCPAAVQSNKKQKGRFSSEDPDHSKAVRRHRVPCPAAPAASRCAERRRGGRTAVPAAGRMGRVHPCAVSAPQRRHPAGTGGAGHPAPCHGGPPPDRQHRRAVDAGRHG